MSDNPPAGCASQPSSIFKFEEGSAAWKRLQQHQTWSDWRCVGLALATGQAEAMVRARTNQPKGKRYREEFGPFLCEYGFDRIDKGARSRLLEVMRNLTPIEAWLEKLQIDKPAKRLQLNHPQTVLSTWKRSKGEKKPTPEVKPEACSVWKSWSKEERRAALDDGGDALLSESFSPEMRAKITKRLKPAKANDEVLGERIRENVDKIRPLLLHYEQHKEEVHRALTAIKRATHGVGKASSTTPPKIDPVVGKAVKEMGNGVDPGESAATAMAVHAAREANI
jgi:hypothetical protein